MEILSQSLLSEVSEEVDEGLPLKVLLVKGADAGHAFEKAIHNVLKLVDIRPFLNNLMLLEEFELLYQRKFALFPLR